VIPAFLSSGARVRRRIMTAMDHKVFVRLGDDHPQARIKQALSYLGIPTSTETPSPLPPLTRLEDRRVRLTVEHLQTIDWRIVGRTAAVPLGAVTAPPLGVGWHSWNWMGVGGGEF